MLLSCCSGPPVHIASSPETNPYSLDPETDPTQYRLKTWRSDSGLAPETGVAIAQGKDGC